MMPASQESRYDLQTESQLMETFSKARLQGLANRQAINQEYMSRSVPGRSSRSVKRKQPASVDSSTSREPRSSASLSKGRVEVRPAYIKRHRGPTNFIERNKQLVSSQSGGQSPDEESS